MGFCYGWLRNTHDARRMTTVRLFMLTDLKLGFLFFFGRIVLYGCTFISWTQADHIDCG
jgi:hypothetical protein